MPEFEFSGPSAMHGGATNDTYAGADTAAADATRADLRGMNYEEGRAALSPCEGGSGTGFHDLFERVDQSPADCGIDRSEVLAHLASIGVGSLSGGVLDVLADVQTKAANRFMGILDTNKDETVTWAEFHNVAKTALPSDVYDEQGQVRPDLIDAMFDRVNANGDDVLSLDEMHKSTIDAENCDERSFWDGSRTACKKEAQITARIGMNTLDLNKSGDITREELLIWADDVGKVMNQPAMGGTEGGGGDQ